VCLDLEDEGALAGRIMKLDGTGAPLAMRYVTAYQDLGYKSITKSGFEVYLLSETKLTVTVGIRTEKKLKTRTVRLEPGKAKRVRLNVSGRSFRLELSVKEMAAAWTLNGGMQINMELDAD
jgi:hypothetical protein